MPGLAAVVTNNQALHVFNSCCDLQQLEPAIRLCEAGLIDASSSSLCRDLCLSVKSLFHQLVVSTDRSMPGFQELGFTSWIIWKAIARDSKTGRGLVALA